MRKTFLLSLLPFLAFSQKSSGEFKQSDDIGYIMRNYSHYRSTFGGGTNPKNYGLYNGRKSRLNRIKKQRSAGF